jgi:hypothetical protein
VLPEKEHAAEHIPGAISIPLKSLGGEARRRLDPAQPVKIRMRTLNVAAEDRVEMARP